MTVDPARRCDPSHRTVCLRDLTGKSLPLLGSLPVRYLSHLTILGLVVVVGLFGRSAAVSQTVEALSSTTTFNDGYAPSVPARSDVLVKPVSPATLYANRPKQEPIVHVVEPGETVASLALRYDITAETIRWANNLDPSDTVHPGHSLVILPISGIRYVAREGDTVEAIATRFQSDARAIVEYNELSEATALEAGDELIIPGGRPPAPSRPQLASRVAIRPTPQPEPTSRPPAAEASPETEAPPAPTATPQPPRPTEYQVAEGDTLFDIAGKFGVAPESIVAANSLGDDGETIQVGQALVIPPANSVLHHVQEGDTLDAIAQHYKSEVEKIAQANEITDPSLVQPGQILVVPDGQIPEPTPPPAPPQPEVPSVTHTVAEGESVVAVAERYGVSVQTIIQANALGDPFMIYPGQQLRVPGGREVQVASRPVAQAAQPVPQQEAAPAPPPPPPPPPAESRGWDIVNFASKYLGYKYVWGGTTPAGFDCTGFVYYVYNQLGIHVPRDMFGQLGSGSRVAREDLQPGDIVFFVNTYAPGVTHNGIYIGGGRFIHAANERSGVIVSGLGESYWAARYHAASRPW